MTNIPPVIYRLHPLRFLFFSFNLIESIDDDIINLSNLVYFYLNINRLKYISSNISKLNRLEKLSLSGNESLNRLPYNMIELKGISIDLRFTSISIDHNTNEDILSGIFIGEDWDDDGLTKYLLNEKIRSDNIKDNINIFINSFDLNSHLWFNIYCIKMIMKKYYYIEMDNI